jgi:hypothetical protein
VKIQYDQPALKLKFKKGGAPRRTRQAAGFILSPRVSFAAFGYFFPSTPGRWYHWKEYSRVFCVHVLPMKFMQVFDVSFPNDDFKDGLSSLGTLPEFSEPVRKQARRP